MRFNIVFLNEDDDYKSNIDIVVNDGDNAQISL